ERAQHLVRALVQRLGAVEVAAPAGQQREPVEAAGASARLVLRLEERERFEEPRLGGVELAGEPVDVAEEPQRGPLPDGVGGLLGLLEGAAPALDRALGLPVVPGDARQTEQRLSLQ